MMVRYWNLRVGAAVFWALAMAAGCSSSSSDSDTSSSASSNQGSGGANGSGASSGSTSPAPGEKSPTYYQDIAPLLSNRCTGCHIKGGIGVFSLTTYEEAKALAPQIAAATKSGAMPPWPPGPKSPAFAYDRHLEEAERALIASWVEAGAPAGDAAKAAPLSGPDVVDIGKTDVAVDIGTDYVPDTSLSDDYHCFLVDLKMTEARVATGYRIIPGNGKIVHHVTTTLFGAESKAAIQALDAQTPDVAGFPCFGGVSNIPDTDPIGTIGGWVPGVSSVAYPAGTGNSIPSGALAVLQIHYNLAGGSDPDRTRLELAFAPKDREPELQQFRNIRLAQPKLNITAGQKDMTFEKTAPASQWAKVFFADKEGYIVGVSGHMHMLGTRFSITMKNPSGEQTLLDIPAWDFHWQGSYQLKTPIPIQASDELTIRCTYDNSEEFRNKRGLGPPVDVKWGEGTMDEMCLGGLSLINSLPKKP